MKKLYVACLAAGIVGMASAASAFTGDANYLAGGGIAISPHNINLTPYMDTVDNADLGRICVYCHTPHFAKKPGSVGNENLAYSPLWNRATPQLNYAMYDNGDNPQEIGSFKVDTNPVDGALDTGLANHNSYAAAMGVWDGTNPLAIDPLAIVNPGTANQPTGVSLMCLSCHDGTIAINAYGSDPSSSTNAGDAAGTMAINTNYSIGTVNGSGAQDLSNHHPIGFSYQTAYDRDDELNAPDSPIGSMVISDLLNGINGNMECNTCHDVHNTKNTGDKLVWEKNTASAFCLACHDK